MSRYDAPWRVLSLGACPAACLAWMHRQPGGHHVHATLRHASPFTYATRSPGRVPGAAPVPGRRTPQRPGLGCVQLLFPRHLRESGQRRGWQHQLRRLGQRRRRLRAGRRRPRKGRAQLVRQGLQPLGQAQRHAHLRDRQREQRHGSLRAPRAHVLRRRRAGGRLRARLPPASAQLQPYRAATPPPTS